MNPATAKYVQQGIRTGGRIGAIGGAVAGGAAVGLPKTYEHNGQTKNFTTGQRVARGLIGAATFGYLGHAAGGIAGGLRNASKSLKMDPLKPSWLKNAKTKAEAQAAWRAHAKKSYDGASGGGGGGDGKIFLKLRKEMDANKKFLKEATLTALADELEKIATIGAILGGAAGYKLAPNTPKGKLLGALIGAGAGHVIQGAGGLAKRKFVDEPHMREQSELYGYQPVAQASQGQNWY